jgi:hypothetical protein
MRIALAGRISRTMVKEGECIAKLLVSGLGLLRVLLPVATSATGS